ncbi:MAG TPA: hypothetical protein VLL82_05275, partial [Mycobacterium sp.]|nr:hypothetical protein [Mycobacterium sp.]
ARRGVLAVDPSSPAVVVGVWWEVCALAGGSWVGSGRGSLGAAGRPGREPRWAVGAPLGGVDPDDRSW